MKPKLIAITEKNKKLSFPSYYYALNCRLTEIYTNPKIELLSAFFTGMLPSSGKSGLGLNYTGLSQFAFLAGNISKKTLRIAGGF